MPHFTVSILLLTMITTGCNKAWATEPEDADSAETKYLMFQLMTGLPGYAGPQPMPGHFALSKMQLEAFVNDVVKAIGTTGDAQHKLGFTVGPLCFDMSDEETRQFIHDSFAVARENDVAVAFHIDDSMCWGERKDLLSNPDNIETADWKTRTQHGPALIGVPSQPDFRPRCVSTVPIFRPPSNKEPPSSERKSRKKSTHSRPQERNISLPASSPGGRPASAAILKRAGPWAIGPSAIEDSARQSAQGSRPRTGPDRQGVHGTLGQLSSRRWDSP